MWSFEAKHLHMVHVLRFIFTRSSLFRSRKLYNQSGCQLYQPASEDSTRPEARSLGPSFQRPMYLLMGREQLYYLEVEDRYTASTAPTNNHISILNTSCSFFLCHLCQFSLHSSCRRTPPGYVPPSRFVYVSPLFS